MQRSPGQILYRYLPGAVFLHEDGFIAKTWKIDANRIEHRVHKSGLLDAVESAAEQWPSTNRNLPLPSTVPPSDFVVLEPVRVDWDVWPLTFQCSNANCGRVKRFFNKEQVSQHADGDKGLLCRVCGWRLTQLSYFAAHACGQLAELYTPECRSCGKQDDIYLEDTGSFETSSWRCRACGGIFVQGTRFIPCRCGSFPDRNGKSFMRLYTVRDRRSHYPQHVSLINLQSHAYQALQAHPHRSQVSLASYLGDESSIARALQDLDAGGSTERMSSDQWAQREAQLRAIGVLSDKDIEAIRRDQGPIDDGVFHSDAPAEVLDIAAEQQMLERSALLDKTGLGDRRTLRLAAEEAVGPLRAPLDDALTATTRLGLAELSVTLQFPVLLAAFGYTRQDRKPAKSTLMSFAAKNLYDGKTPIFAMAAETEALMVELSALDIHGWLVAQKMVLPVAELSERSARLAMLQVFAEKGDAAHLAKTLVHSMSHSFLRALDDGQSGFGESSLAEWLSPHSLTFAIYVSSYQEFSIGALWTLMHSRVRAWMERIEESAFRCDNDPLCHNRSPRACERCLFLTFGCRDFNEDLSRTAVMDFLRYKAGAA